MAINYPTFQQFDYGAAVQSGQKIQENRIRNQMLGVAQQEQMNVLRNRRKSAEIRRSVEGMPDQIRELEKAGLFDEADKLRESYVKFQTGSIQMIRAMRGGINADNYKEVRGQLVGSGSVPGEMMPEEYSDSWFQEQETAAQTRIDKITVRSGDQSMDVIYKGGKPFYQGKPYTEDEPDKGPTKVITTTYQDPATNKVMRQDFHYVNGKEVPAGDPYPADAMRGGQPWTMNASESNGIRKALAELFEGNYDINTGKYQNITARTVERKQLAALAERAEEIYISKQGQIGMTQAAIMAAKEAKIDVPFPDLSDPLGVRTDEDEAGGGPSRPLG